MEGSGIGPAGQRRCREGGLGEAAAEGNDDDAGLDRGPVTNGGWTYVANLLNAKRN